MLTHAVMDSLLGALALGDIGKHFPDTDPRYKGADSIALLRHVAALVRESGWQLGNLDATVLAQALGGTGHDTGKRHPTIGNNVLISTGAKVLGPFKVGDNSRIGANAVVLQEVPPDSTVVGIKARVVKIAGQRVGPSPAYALDQINLPDPLAQELCRLQNRVYANEQKLKKEEEREREADK